MPVYEVAPDELINKIKPYLKRGEIVKVSDSFEIFGKRYKQIVFTKKVFGSFSGEPGYLFIYENGEVVTKKQIQRELSKLGYYFDIFFDEENKISIFKAVQSEEEIKRDVLDSQYVVEGLKFLSKNDVKGAEEIISIVTKVPELRKKNNEKLNELIEMVKHMKEREEIFNDIVFEKMYDLYKEALILNFEKVKTISQGQEYYKDLKKASDKYRKKFSVRFNRRITEPLMKTHYSMEYFSRIINTYKGILDLDVNGYTKFLKESEFKNITNKITLIRN